MATSVVWCVTVALVGILQGVSCFGFPHFLQLERSLVARDTNQDNQAANAVIDVILRLADTDGNGVVTLQEVRNGFDRVVEETTPPGRTTHPEARKRYAEQKGYLMTVVIVADVDGSQALERNELERAARILITQAGRVQAAKVIEAETYLLFTLNHPEDDQMVDAMLTAMDVNGDEAISLGEMTAFHTGLRFGYSANEAREFFGRTDENMDDKLNREEIGQWIKLSYQNRKIFTYARIKELAGNQIAKLWSNRRY